ncbi:MAG TPA: cytochrome c maturation protein CcmE [Firmicutes bacterium]|nr:cytochrome c maturation protein CcmE [Bacillota bacterium]
MKNKTRWIIGVAVIIVFAGFAFFSFRSALNPYVSFAEAAQTRQQVQVLGYFVEGEPIQYNSDAGELRFSLVDEEGTTATVTYRGARPNNLEHSENVVVVGEYREGVFQAEKILVKCPSKYEEAEDNR